MHRYRTHTCGELRKRHAGQTIGLSGWIHRRRDHGGVVFLDLRDHYGITQLVISPENDAATTAAKIPRESVIRVVGDVRERSPAAINSAMKTGGVEIAVRELEVLSSAEPLPFSVAEDPEVGESTRLSYRFLDLRRAGLHRRIQLRSDVIASIRQRMTEMGFAEFQTPILTSSSPEGARDYLVPSRLYPGHFYALPQAPQQFKQLLMVSGFDRYFQIALVWPFRTTRFPCRRVAWLRWRRNRRWRSRRISTTSSATASNCRAVLSATTDQTSCTRRSK